jgi:hypothetical protein
MKFPGALAAHPDLIAASIIFERNMEWLMNVADPVDQET